MIRIGETIELDKPLKLVDPLALAVYKEIYNECLPVSDNGIGVDIKHCEKMMLVAIYEMLVKLTGAGCCTDNSGNDSSNATHAGNDNSNNA